MAITDTEWNPYETDWWRLDRFKVRWPHLHLVYRDGATVTINLREKTEQQTETEDPSTSTLAETAHLADDGAVIEFGEGFELSAKKLREETGVRPRSVYDDDGNVTTWDDPTFDR